MALRALVKQVCGVGPVLTILDNLRITLTKSTLLPRGRATSFSLRTGLAVPVQKRSPPREREKGERAVSSPWLKPGVSARANADEHNIQAVKVPSYSE